MNLLDQLKDSPYLPSSLYALVNQHELGLGLAETDLWLELDRAIGQLRRIPADDLSHSEIVFLETWASRVDEYWGN